MALVGCSNTPEPVREQFHVFGSIASIELRGVAREQAQAPLADISTRLAQLHRDWHPWQASPLTDLNAALAAGDSHEVPESIAALIERSRPLSEASDGLFDPTSGGLIAMWGFHTSEYPVRTPPPSAGAVRQWLELRPRLADITLEGRRVHSRSRTAQLDFGAIAEGSAAEQVLRILHEHGIAHALVDIGGDMVALGSRDGAAWRVSLRDPFGGILGGVGLRDGEALFSSGNYNKFRDAPDGGRWPHVLDLRTGYPATGAASVAVLHSDPVLADAAATALFAGGPAQFALLAERLRLGCAMMITDENELLVTRAMQSRLQLLRSPVTLGTPVDLGEHCTLPD